MVLVVHSEAMRVAPNFFHHLQLTDTYVQFESSGREIIINSPCRVDWVQFTEKSVQI